MTITADVKGCTVSLRQPPLSGGTVGAVTVAFRFDEVWDGYVRTAVFRARGKTVLLLLENDRCMLPPEATAGGDVLLGAFGVRGDATLTTKFCRLAVSPGVPTAGDSAAAVTPTLGAQLLAAYGRLTAATAEAVAGDSAAVRVSEKADSLHFAFTLPKGDKGADGKDGYTPVRGKDYWTKADREDIQLDINLATELAHEAAVYANKAADAANTAVSDLEAKVAAGDFKGAPGNKGDKGDPGADGYTPVRGTDYWTDNDKAEIKSYVDESVVAARPAFSLLSEITLAEDASIVDITADSAGAALSLSSALLVVTVEPAAKKCYLSCLMYHGSTNSYFSTNGISTSKCGSTFLVHDIGGIRQVYIRNIGTNSIGPATNTQIGMFADGNPLTHFTLRSYDTSVSPAEWGSVALPAGTKIQLYGVKA